MKRRMNNQHTFVPIIRPPGANDAEFKKYLELLLNTIHRREQKKPLTETDREAIRRIKQTLQTI